ncbi:AraC family transcriptional regulator [Companilactobacillus sp. HBUAS56257]|uniref:AraC family transcriptional regulator n=1 Tax=Companilactobacillus sp. HBUAS56257 TaxID=3109360 RepID=UPI002FF07189
MDQKTLDILMKYSDIEKYQKINHKFKNNVPNAAIIQDDDSSINIPNINEYFFKNHDIYISKHNRFASYPTHKHKFLEMNYCYNGNCTEIVDDDKVSLKKGDLILLDVGCSHSVDYLGEKDILINILFRDQDINLATLNDLRGTESVLFDFLINRIIKSHKNPKSIVFRKTNKNMEISDTLEKIIDEYILNKEFSNTIIKSYLNILLIQLVRNYKNKRSNVSQTKSLIIRILHDITVDYANISLETVAMKYNYNKNYLSNLFKEEVGENFIKVLTRERIMKAHELIQTTSLPICEIINSVGIKNLNFFYSKYKEQYDEMPNQTRCK